MREYCLMCDCSHEPGHHPSMPGPGLTVSTDMVPDCFWKPEESQ